MAARRFARHVVSGLFLAGAIGVLALGAALVSHAPGGGRADAWLLAWSLLFVVVLPVGAVVMTAGALLRQRDPAHGTVPRAGLNIPESGQ